MGAYTQSIREILQYNKTSTEDLTNISDVYNIAARCLFDKAPINVLSNNYREQFITGFTLHFMNDELGLETLPLWKIALNEKLYNNASYINLIFDNLSKQIFADYTLTTSATNGENEQTTLGTGTIGIESTGSRAEIGNDTTSHSQSTDSTHNQSDTGNVSSTDMTTGEETTTQGGTDTNRKTGTDTRRNTGTQTNAKTGNDSVEKTGTDTIAATGSDITAHTGGSTHAVTRSDETDGTGTSSNTNSSNTAHDLNSIGIAYDTPMGSLNVMRVPGGDARGTGVSYPSTQQYNYMSAANETDQSDIQSVTGSDSGQTTNHSETTGTETVQDTQNLEDRTTHGKTDTTTHNTTDTTKYASTDTRTDNLTDEVEYGGIDTRTLDLEDQKTYNDTKTNTTENTNTTIGTDKTNVIGADETNTSHTSTESGSNTTTRNTTDKTTGNHSDTGIVETFRLNWEMLYRSMPLLNKVWDIFDDLFMLIY